MTYPGSHISVDTAGLRAVATQLDHVSSELDAAAGKTDRNAATPPQAAAVGWTSTTAARTAAQQWLAELRSLAGLIGQTGADVRTAAHAYDGADQDAAARHGRVRFE